MKILYVGAGFVGACSAAVSASSGHEVLVYDISSEKVDALNSGKHNVIEKCLFEKGLSDLLIRNKNRISFTNDYNEVNKFLDQCDAIFMCLPTPEIGQTGESDLTYYFEAAEILARNLKKRNETKQSKYIVIINKSTVPIEMIDKTEELMKSCGVENFGVVSNPEFLVEGKAIQNSLKPNRVVVGANTERDFEIIRDVYRRFYDAPDVLYIEVNPKEAAAGKLLANFYLFNKVQVCFDIIGRTCETFDDLHFENIRNILMTDPRIGNWGFYNSLYAGGSCFIKDARSLAHQLQNTGVDAGLINETHSANKRQLQIFLSRAEKELQYDWSGKTVALLGTSFKRDTNDIRNSPSVDVVNFLTEKKVSKINIFDPAGHSFFEMKFPQSDTINYFDDEFTAINKSGVVIISTDWPQFRWVSDYLLRKKGDKPLIMDGRRMMQHQYNELQENGFDIIAVGSPIIKGKK